MKKEKQTRRSLSAKVLRSALLGSLVLGIVAFLIGFGLYSFSMVDRYISQAFNIAKYANWFSAEVGDFDDLITDTLEIYHSLPEEELSQTGSEAYRARFRHITEREDYKKLKNVLGDFLDASEVHDVYMVVYDSERSAIVYIVDPIQDPALYFSFIRTVCRKPTITIRRCSVWKGRCSRLTQ